MVKYYCENLCRRFFYLLAGTRGKEKKMYKRFVNSLYVLNILFQAFFTLLVPVGLGALVAYLLTTFTDVGGWIWAVLLILGVFSGLYSMIKYILTAMAALERLEKERNARATSQKAGKSDDEE